MSDHPLKMKDKLKGKKRPVTRCKIFVGDPDEYKTQVEESFANLVGLLKDFDPESEMPEPMKIAGKAMVEDLLKMQEPYYQTFVFRAMPAVAFEKLIDEYPARPNTTDEVYNWETFPPRIFKECLVEPVYDTMSDEEWAEFFTECSHKEYDLLMRAGMDSNLRNIEPSTPKDLMTR